MEKKINIAELLKDCPSGMELDCMMFEGIEFDSIVDNENFPIRCRIKNSNDEYNFFNFTKYGYWNNDYKAKCVIFPKGKTSWEGFHRPFEDGDKIHLWTIQDAKDGDVIFYDDGWTCIFKCIHDYGIWYSSYCFITDEGEFHTGYERHAVDSKINGNAHLATKEQCNLLFQKIKEAGYHWNAETKTLEKLIELKEDTNDEIVMSDIYFDREYYADEVELHLNNYEIKIRDGKTYAIFKNQETKILKPKFKVGDVVKSKNRPEAGSFVIVDVKEDAYSINLKKYCIKFKDQDNYELINAPKFKVGDRIKHKCEKFRDERTITSYGKGGYWTSVNDWIDYNEQDNWELVPNKFDITTLKPFDKVLVKTDVHNPVWSVDFYDGYNIEVGGSFTPFAVTGGKYFQQCIPYKGNEHLRGTTNDCDDFYKTWEK